MKKILIVTVGGSCVPIVNAIKGDRYDHIIFICSTGGKSGSDQTVDGKGRPCKRNRDDDKGQPSIVEQTGLKKDEYEKLELSKDMIDDLQAVYLEIKSLGKKLQVEFPDATVVANYTGGTKTMSASLVLAALVFDWQLNLNTGVRTDLVKIKGGDIAVPLSAEVLKADQFEILIQKALDVFDYAMAASIAEELAKKLADNRLRQKWLVLYNIASGFNKWDAFDYEEALNILQDHGAKVGKWLPFLRHIASKDKPTHGYYVVKDLLFNAQRRALQKRYDDAVARLYRATELLAQTRLKEGYDMESDNITIDLLKDRLAEEELVKYQSRPSEKGVLKLGLAETYKLLNLLKDPLGNLFSKYENKLLDALKTRNYSFLAHGLNPIGKENFDMVFKCISSFIDQGIEAISFDCKGINQLPRKELL